jgi:hypothetical protein
MQGQSQNIMQLVQAINKVEAELIMAKQKGWKSLTLIVGKGLHSGPAGPVLKPALIKYLEHRKIPFEVGRPLKRLQSVERQTTFT